MRRVVCIAVLVLAVAGCGSASKPNPTLIVVDRSIGGVSLKEKRRDVDRLLGAGVVVKTDDQKPPEPPAHGEFVRYPKAGLEVVYVSKTAGRRADGLAIAVLTTSPRYRTKEGVHVGSSVADVRRIHGIECFGSSDCQHGNVHNKPGTGFALRGGRVWRIAVGILD